MAMQLPPSKRTQGDGMEKVEKEAPTEQEVVLNARELVEPILLNETKKTLSKTNINLAVKLNPKTIDKKKKDIFSNLKNKEPKFVPYEPYKAAVRPIMPLSKKSAGKEGSKARNNFVPAAKVNNSRKSGNFDSDKEKESENINWEMKCKVLESEMQILKEENEQLENQLKFQVQVNGELKNLLVAAVGEDMETKVHVLTEDKLHLAQALLKSAESLTTHQEQTEWLAGQCEVWRSKFLACSMMVEELARWKAALSQKINEAHDVLKKLVEERKQVEEYVVKSHRNLCQLRDNFDLRNKKSNLKDYSVIELSDENLKLTEVLILELLGSKKASANENFYLYNLKKTSAEKSAENILMRPSLRQLIAEPDEACNAVVGAAVTLNSQLYLQNHPPKIECCRQCSGNIKLI